MESTGNPKKYIYKSLLLKGSRNGTFYFLGVIMNKEKETRQKELSKFDYEIKKYIMYMCKKGCKFYDERCTKGRIVRDCAKKGLKNKE